MKTHPNELLADIEAAGLWNLFQKDWLLNLRQSLRDQLPRDYRLFVETDADPPEFDDDSIETRYWLTIRRSPGQEIVAVMELLSPSNKGIGNRLDRQKHLRKREEFLDAGVNLLEIDALLEGERDLPSSVARLKDYQRVAWAVVYHDGRRRFQGWGWDLPDRLPKIQWQVDAGHRVRVDLEGTLADAVAFNDWESMVV